jgi:hypothetical protein
MTEQGEIKKQGHVEFHQPPVKLVAERPADKNIEEENARLQAENPNSPSCGGV